MKNKYFKKIAFSIISIAFWLFLWKILSITINVELILPAPEKVFSAFASLVFTLGFWKICLASILRITAGIIIGILLGLLLSPITHYSAISKAIISPFMTVIRSAPVASFIIVLWLIIGSSNVPTVVTTLMVMPIVWQNLCDGFNAIDKNLSEVCDCYQIPFSRRIKLLIGPTLRNYLIPGIITSASLGWKSGIAAEIIAYTSNSIGREILNAKSFFETAQMLAWTMAVIIFSLVIEVVVKSIGRRFSN